MSRLRPYKLIILVATLPFVLYVGAYIALSLNGRYEPAAIGLNGVKSYGWAPHGFVTNYQWHRTPMLFFCPLHMLDERYWHKPGDAHRGTYPVNKVAAEDIWEVYRANGF